MKLEIEGLTKRFGNHPGIIIDHLVIDNCKRLAILGPSGSGKSTLLRMIGGLIKPDTGTISVGGDSVGVVFQSFNLFPHLTALENIVLPLVHVHKMRREEATEKSMSLLKRFDLEKQAHKRPSSMSGGEAQRVALIRAIAPEPKLLLLDEPTSALDPMMTSEVLELISELQNDIIMVTHHLGFAKRTSDHVIFIAKGKVLECASSDAFFERPASQEAKNYLEKVLEFS